MDDLFNQAISLHQAGKLEEAKQLYQKIILAQPDHALVTHHTGLITAQQGFYQEAIELFKQAILLDNKQASFHNNLGKTLRILGKTSEAIDCFHKALEINPGFSDALLNLGNTLKEAGRLEEAIRYYNQFLTIHPDNADAHISLGSALRLHGNLDASINSLKKGLAINPESSVGYNNLGNVLGEQGKLNDAISAYTKAININPGNVDAIYNLGFSLRQTGRTDDAIKAYRQALTIKPDNALIYQALTAAGKFTVQDDDIKKMQVLLNNDTTSQTDRMLLCFALGKAFEDLKEYNTSFDYILTANKIKRDSLNYDLNVDKNFMQSLIKIFDKTFFANRASYGINDKMPVFILGMPRSGTTLAEQILSSHPQVFGAGEISDIVNIILNENPKITGKTFPEIIPTLEKNEVRHLAETYLTKIRSLAENEILVSNKMPSNFLFIGMIRLMFPGAKIIHCKRDPADTCLSCFKNYFPNGQEFSYDLSELGKYYTFYQQLMNHWHATLPGYIYDLNYEDLIIDQENQTQRLLHFCELPWDDACLSFHNSSRAIRTVSIEQARKPIYKSSIQGWKRYKNQLAPLLKELS